MSKASSKSVSGDRGGPKRGTGPRKNISVGRRTTEILDGKVDLAAWSDEELERGRRRDKGGFFRGKKPSVVPRAIHEELVRRRMREADRILLEEGTVAAVALWVKVVKDEEADMTQRLRASENIIDRVRGKAAQPIYVAGPDPNAPTKWDQLVESAIHIVGTERDARALEAGNIVEGEIVEPPST